VRHNTIPTKQERAEAAWADVQSQYQRRADLIPNLVATVQGAAIAERTTLTEVIDARARATSVQISPETLSDPAAFQTYQAAQGQLTGALSRLLATVEAYPNIQSNQNFVQLQSQLEGTENRITISRRDYNEAVRDYNTSLRTFPTVIWAKTFQSGSSRCSCSPPRPRPRTPDRDLQRRPPARPPRPGQTRRDSARRHPGFRARAVKAFRDLPAEGGLASAGLLARGCRSFDRPADPTFPGLSGRVVDQAHLLQPAQEAALVAKLEKLEPTPATSWWSSPWTASRAMRSRTTAIASAAPGASGARSTTPAPC
jgi:hypothetical protein